jgi:hypothetical protein
MALRCTWAGEACRQSNPIIFDRIEKRYEQHHALEQQGQICCLIGRLGRLPPSAVHRCVATGDAAQRRCATPIPSRSPLLSSVSPIRPSQALPHARLRALLRTPFTASTLAQLAVSCGSGRRQQRQGIAFAILSRGSCRRSLRALSHIPRRVVGKNQRDWALSPS